ncbi:pentapeptide repeat-containing protein [Amycolatopsis taiwanensis]|uniref:pentapeptide repeat-containing protein n=1 Tax=Amycolatopsis taiwanensis TaxID=342230 RepID=UPI00255349F3|nr:pentapeptide repeat-containing protein [Amycolatopsis taiwanensis]
MKKLSWWLVAGCSLAALVAGLGIGWWAWPSSDVAGNDRVQARTEAIRTGLTATGGAGAAFALLLAFRRQRATEHAAGETQHDATERRVTELYAKAVEQLGHASAAVRLGGLHALERLAEDYPRQRRPVVSVLCAYLRMPYRATFAGDVDFQETTFTAGTSFQNATFIGGAWFGSATFTAHGWFTEVNFFDDTMFDGATFRHASFEKANFAGFASFTKVIFRGDANFKNAIFGEKSDFNGTQLVESDGVIRAWSEWWTFSHIADGRRMLIMRQEDCEDQSRGAEAWRGTATRDHS